MSLVVWGAAATPPLDLLDPSEPLYNATVTVLGEYVSHHIKEEQEHIPKDQEIRNGSSRPRIRAHAHINGR